ncbi:MAG: RsmF rRNA methyltransferase first C-terminal domain-containing protein [Clostridiales bacterium]|nr:RsmF rRNA methyltransferase first C-terminal domain-containing protein [Clostridiales bacterium]
MRKYPTDFVNEINDILKDNKEAFWQAYKNTPYRGLRVNTLKSNVDLLKDKLGFALEKTPFCTEGYYLPYDEKSVGNNPLHLAGAFYMQEPSAMAAAELLCLQPGERVLDLCAAPGGKSTQIAAKLCSKGLIWSNEIIRTRASILLSNMERCGVKNSIISSCTPETLCGKMKGFFDKILVDAPCSGEGMFRRDPQAASEWSRSHVLSCANRQLMILNTAKDALKPGGVLVYSTCTFSREENEGVIEKFLEQNKNFELDTTVKGHSVTLKNGCVRIFPQDGGEGHFCARLIKTDGETAKEKKYLPSRADKKDIETAAKAINELFVNNPFGQNYSVINGSVYCLPDGMPDISGLQILRAGVYMGDIVKNRFEPSHAAFVAAKPNDCINYVNFDINDERLYKYLRGEELEADDLGLNNGYCAVCVEGITLGFGKYSQGRLKNKYPKGLRING